MARSRFQGKSQSSASRKSLWLPSCQIDELSDISRREVALSLSRTFPVERGSNAFKNRDGARRVAVLLGETPTAVHRRLQNFSSAAAAQLSSSTAETMRSRRSSSASSGSRSAAAGGAPPVAEEDADDSLDESVVRTVVQYAAHMSSGSASSSSAVGSASGHKSASAADSADGAQPAIGALLRAQWDGRLPTAASDPAQTSTVMSAPVVAASSAPSTAVEASSTATGSSCRPTDLLRQPRLQINNRVLKRLRDGRDLTYLGEQDTSESANAVQQPSASSTAGGYVTCGPCGSRRYVAVPSLCYKFGSWVCLHCIKFILKMLKNGSSSLKCLDQHGCAIGPSVSADPSDAGPAADPVDPESRCPACWLQRCLLALNFAEERHTRLRCCLPRALQSAVPPFSRKARCETGRCEPAPPPSLLPAVSAAVPVNGVAGGGAKLWSVPAAPGFEVISRTSAPQLPTSQTASVQPAVFSGEPPVVSSAEPLAVSSAEPLAASSAEPPLRRKTVVVVQLGDGWRRRETVRKGGRLDRVVCSPGGMRFKSVVELQAHLRSSGCPPSSAKDYFFREATAAVKQKTPLTDQAPRNSCAKRGPRVKLVCRSASVALGQPRATFADLHADVAPVPQLAPAQSSLPPSPPSTPPPPAQPDREEEEDSATPQPSGSAAVASTSPASRDSRTRLRRKRRRKLVVEDRGSRNIRLKLKVLNKYKHLKSARAATGLKSARAGAGLKPGSGRVRMSRCRACAGCRSKNCRQCVFCHDMVKYGGPGKLKKSCVARTCKRPLLPGVSELKFQTSAAGGSDAVDAVKPRGCRGRAPGTSAVRRTPSALYKSRLHRPLLHPLGQQGVRKRLAFRKRAAGVRQLHRPQTDGLDEAAGEDDAADTSSVLLDTWLPEDLGEIWRHGLAVVLTEPLEVPLLCFICGSHGSEELVFCNSCCEPFHAFCLDECEVPVTAGQLDSWLCRRCQLCAICGCPAADDDQLLARCRQCNDTFHRACGDPHSCVDDAKLADRQPWTCGGCTRCRSCRRAEIHKYVGNLPLCSQCYQLHQGGNLFPQSGDVHSQHAQLDMVMECESCHTWVHAGCERLSSEQYETLRHLPAVVSYLCDRCLPEPPAVTTVAPLRDVSWKYAVREELVRGCLSLVRCVWRLVSSASGWEEEERRLQMMDAELRMGGEAELPSVAGCDDRLAAVLHRMCSVDSVAGVDAWRRYKLTMRRRFPWYGACDVARGGEVDRVDGSTESAVPVPPSVTPTSPQRRRPTAAAGGAADWPRRLAELCGRQYRSLRALESGRTPHRRRCRICGHTDDHTSVATRRQCGRLVWAGGGEWLHAACLLLTGRDQPKIDVDGSVWVNPVSSPSPCCICRRAGASLSCADHTHNTAAPCLNAVHLPCVLLQDAAADGWMLTVAGLAFCPQHRPAESLPSYRPAALLHRRLMVDLECRRRRSATSVPMNSVSVVIGSLTVHKLGKQVVACAGSCLLVPVEMVCSRVYWSTVNPRRRTVYTVRVTSTLTSTTRSTTSLLLHHTVDHGLPKQQLEEALALLEKWHESTADAAVGPGDERVNEVAAPSSVVAPGSVVALGSVVAPGFVVAPGSGEVSHRHQPGVLLMSDGTRQTSSSSAVAGDRLVTAAADSQSDGVLTGSGGSTGVSSAADDQRDAEVRACVDTLVSHVCRSVVEEEEETLLADANLNIPILESMDNDFLTLMLNELCEGEAAASSTGPAASPSAPSPSNNSTAASPEQAAPSIADSSDVTAPLESPTTPSVVQPQAGPGVQLQQDARRSSAPMCDVIRGTSAPLLVTPEPTRGGPSSEYFGRMMFSTGGVAEHQLTRAAFSGGDHQSAFRPAGRRSSTGSVAPLAAPTAAANEQQAAVVKPMAAVMPEPREQLLATSWGYNPHAHHQMYSAAAAQMGYYHHHHHRSPPPPYPQHHMQPPAAPQLLYPHHWAVPQQASAAGGWGCPPHQSTSGQQLWPTAQTGVGGAAKPTEQLQYQHQDWTGQRLWQLDGAGDEEYARPLDDNSPAKCPRCRRLYRTRPSMLRHSATCTMDVDTSSGDESADEDVAPHQQQPVELGETEVSSTTAPSVAAVEVKQEPADSSPVPVAVHHQPPQPVHHRAPIQPSAGSSSGAGKVSRRRSPKKRVAPYLVVPPEPRPHVAAAVPAPLPAIHMPQPQWVMLGNGQLLQLPPVSAAPQQLQQSNVLMMPSPAYTLMAAPMPQQQQPHHQQAGFMYPTLMGLPQGASVQHLGSFELNSPLVYSLPLASAPPPLQAPQQVGPPIVVPTAPSPVQSCLVDSSRPLSTEPAIPTSAQMMFQSPSPAAVSSPRPSTSARGDSPPIFHPPSVPPPPATVAVVNLCQPSPTDSPMERHVVAPAAPPPPPLVRQSSLYVQPPPPQPYVRQRVQQHALQQHQSQPATPQLPASVVQSVLDAISTVAQPMPSRFILSDSRQHPHQPEISRSTAADSRQCQHQPEVSRSIAADDAPSATTGVNNAIKSRLNVSQTADDSSGGCNTNIKDIRKVAKIKPRPTYSYRDAMKTSSTLPADRVICRLVQRDGGTLLSAGTSSGSAVPHRSSVLAAASTPSSAVVAASTPSSSAVVAASTPSSSAVVAASIPSSSGAVAGPIQGTSKMSYRIKLRRDPHHQLGYQVREVVQHGGVDCGANAGVLPSGAAVRSVCITARMGPNDQSTYSTAGAGCSGQSVVARATSQSRQLNAGSRTSSSATFSPTRQQFRQPASGAHIPAPAGEDSDKENSGHRVGIDGATVAPPLDADITPGVVYEITSADGFKFRSSHASDIWRSVFDAVQEARAGLKMRPLSYNKTALNGHQMLGLTHSVVQALLEQMPGTENCTQHQFRFRDQRVVRQSSPPLEGSRLGCARAEGFSGPRKRLDLFGWLASTHRLPPEPTSPAPAVSSGAVSAASTVSSKCWRRSASLELPVAMRYRQLCDTYRRQVGVYRSRISGRGLFCRRAVEPGEMVIEYFGEVIRASLADVRERRYGTRGIGCYMFRIDDDWVVDATKCGNGARFINHSCNPNCYSRVVDVLGQKRIIIFALRPICRGEELTYDYKFPIEEDKIPCHCGARRCRKYLN